jgi:hypothetical protein
MKLIVGVTIALLFSGILIFSIENDCSLIQIVFGFVVYLIPIIFVSEIKNIPHNSNKATVKNS